MMLIDADQLGSTSSRSPQLRNDRVLVGQPTLIHSTAHARSRGNRKPKQVSSVRQRCGRWISPADVMFRQCFLIDVHNSRAVHTSGRHLHAPEKLWGVRTVTETQNLNLNHGRSRLQYVGRRTAGRKRGCRERQDQYGDSHQVIVESGVHEVGVP